MSHYKPLLLSLVISVSTSTLGSEKITFVADEWCPFNCEPGSSEPGYIVEVLREVFTDAGYTIEYFGVPWTRSVLMTRQGHFNAIIGATISEAPDFIFPEEEFNNLSADFFVHKGNPWRFQGIESLQEVTLGAIAEYNYSTEIDEYISNNPDKVVLSAGDNAIEINIKRLNAGRIDAIINQESVLNYTANSLGLLDNIEFAGDDNEYDAIYVAFSPKHPQSQTYASILDQGIRRLRESGQLDIILSRYGLEDWKR